MSIISWAAGGRQCWAVLALGHPGWEKLGDGTKRPLYPGTALALCRPQTPVRTLGAGECPVPKEVKFTSSDREEETHLED